MATKGDDQKAPWQAAQEGSTESYCNAVAQALE